MTSSVTVWVTYLGLNHTELSKNLAHERLYHIPSKCWLLSNVTLRRLFKSRDVLERTRCKILILGAVHEHIFFLNYGLHKAFASSPSACALIFPVCLFLIYIRSK